MFNKKRDVTLKISGMHCGSCVEKVSDVLKSLGCKSEISLEFGTAVVKCPEDMTNKQILEAISKAGYGASCI